MNKYFYSFTIPVRILATLMILIISPLIVAIGLTDENLKTISEEFTDIFEYIWL
jgi:hypothetical protein